MVLPFISGSWAIRTAAATAAPQEMPERIPSSFARRRAISIDSSSLDQLHAVHHLQIQRIRDESRADALNPCGPGRTGSPARVCVITGLPSGSTPTERIGFFFSSLK